MPPEDQLDGDKKADSPELVSDGSVEHSLKNQIA